MNESTLGPLIQSNEPTKPTEVGELPSSWDLARIGELFNVQQGKALSPSARNGISPRPFLRTANVFWGRLDLNSLDQMDFTADEAERLTLRAGDLLVCEGGEIGRTAVWNGEIGGCLYQNHIHRLRCSGDNIVPHFVMYWMQAAFLHLGLYGGIGNKTTIPNLSGARLKQLSIPIPPFPEQRAIAAVLSKIQRAVDLQGKIVATLKELKAATVAKLFREGLHGEPLKQTEIGEIPDSWEVVRLGDVCSYTTGKLNSEKAVERGEYPFFTCSQETFRIDSFSFDQEALLLAGNNAQGKYSVKYYRGKFDAYQRTYVISINDTSRLKYQFLLHELTRKLGMLRRNSLGATTKYLTASVISNLEIAKPCLEEQEEFSNILSAIDDSIGKEEKRHTMLKSLFASMLHLLMTGQVRVAGVTA